MISIREVHPSLLHEVRRRVLRDGRADARVHDDRDEDVDAIHFAAFHDESVVGSVSVYPSSPLSSDSEGKFYQLRYLAVDTALQRTGIGSLLMRAVEDRLGSRGIDCLWANARDTALDFYRQTGWRVLDGSDHLSRETQLLHHVILKQLKDHRPFEVRRANENDVMALVDLRARLMYAIDLADERGEWLRATSRYFETGFETGNVLGWVATADNFVIGSAMAELRTTPPSPRKTHGRVAYIHTVTTVPTFRRRGVSRLLVERLLGDLEESSLDVVELHATDQGRSLYEQLGFTLRAENEMRRGMRQR